MEFLLNEDARTAHIQALQSLPSAIEKVKYWLNSLGINYFKYSEFSRLKINETEKIDLTPFKFEIRIQEWESFALWVIDNYDKYNPGEEKSLLLNPDAMEQAFLTELEDSPDRTATIQKELHKVSTSFIPQAITYSQPSILLGAGSEGVVYSNLIYQADYKTYNDFLRDFGKAPNYSNIFPSIANIVKAANGVSLAKYRISLEKLTQQPESPNPEEHKMNMKLLLMKGSGELDYLRNKIPVKDRLYKYLSHLLGYNYYSIKKALIQIENEKSKIYKKENLELLANALDDCDLTKEADGVRERLKALYSKEK